MEQEQFITDYLDAFRAANPLCMPGTEPTITKTSPGWYELIHGFPVKKRRSEIEAMTERLKARVGNVS